MCQKGRKFFFISSLLLGCFYFFLSLLVHRDIFRGFDYESMVWVQSVFGRFVDIPFSFITLIGSTEIISLILMGISIYVFFVRRRFFLSLLVYFLIFIIEIFGKIFIYHPLPPATFYRYALNFNMPSGAIIDTSFSYPSGHMARVIFLSVVSLFLILHAQTRIRNKVLSSILIGGLVLVVFVSRIYLGEHWFSDVLGGLLLGGWLATLSLAFW